MLLERLKSNKFYAPTTTTFGHLGFRLSLDLTKMKKPGRDPSTFVTKVGDCTTMLHSRQDIITEKSAYLNTV